MTPKRSADKDMLPQLTTVQNRELFERVKLSRTLGLASEVGPSLFELLRKFGKVSKISGPPSFGTRESCANVERDRQGRLYVTKGTLTFELGAFIYEIEIKSTQRDLSIEVEAEVRALEPLEALLAQVESTPRVSVVKDRISPPTAAHIYQSLRGRSVLVAGHGSFLGEDRWNLRLDEVLGVLPERLTVELLDASRPFRVKFKGEPYRGTFEIAVESSLDQGEQAAEFLRELVQEAEPQQPLSNGEDPEAGKWEVEVHRYRWKDLAGIDAIRTRVRQWVELPLLRPDGFAKLGIRPPKGILLYGPPGTGKSTIAKTAANESSAAFFSISPAEINSMWYGGSSRNIRRLFQRLRLKANEGGGAVLFIDELDGFLRSRDHESHEATRRTLSQLMMELDSITPDLRIVVLAATNRREDLDAALCRPGRFDHHLEVPLPDRESRAAILAVHLRDKPSQAQLRIGTLAQQSEGLSGADLEQWCNDAAFRAWQRLAEKLGQELSNLTPSQLESIRITNADFAETKPDNHSGSLSI